MDHEAPHDVPPERARTEPIPPASEVRVCRRLAFARSIWGTGQDQVAAIKRQLCLLVPGVSIFLDVDDLEEISALERYIAETAVVLIFLSKGYFRWAKTSCEPPPRCLHTL